MKVSRSAGIVLGALALPIALMASPTSASPVDGESSPAASGEANATAVKEALAAVPDASYSETIDLRDSGQGVTKLSDAVSLAPVDASGPGITVEATKDGAGMTSLTIEPVGVRDDVDEIDGLLTWDGGSTSPSAVAQPIPNGVRIMSVFASAASPTEAVTSFDAGESITPTFFDDGALVLHSSTDDEFLGLIESPWAVDANGKRVKTWYEWRNGALVQHVDHTGGDYAYPIVADPAWTYSFDAPALSAAGYASPGMNAPTAMTVLRQCFNCSFPIGNAPRYLTTTQIINLNASPFSFIEVPAPVKTTEITGVGFTFVAQAGHFDGAGSEITFRFYSTCGGTRPWLHLNVNARVIKDRGDAANAANAAMAKRQWQRFLNNINENAIAQQGLQRC